MRTKWTNVLIALIALTAISLGNEVHGEPAMGLNHSAYHWLPGTLIPNEFALPNGKWSNRTRGNASKMFTAFDNGINWESQDRETLIELAGKYGQVIVKQE